MTNINVIEGFELNSNEKVVKSLLRRIEMNNGECPCTGNDSVDKHCPCSNYRENDHCCCRLYVKKK